MPNHQCQFCLQTLPTLQGLQSHLTQKQSCRDALRELVRQKRRISTADTALPDINIEENFELHTNPHPHLHPPASSASKDASHRVRVEEVEDEEAGGLPKKPWVRDFPTEAASILDHRRTSFETIREQKDEAGDTSWAPFTCKEEWELAKWLMSTGLSQNAVEDYLTLPITQNRTKLSFHNKRAFFQKIDALPRGPSWTCEPFEVTGDLTDDKGQTRVEEVELWKRDPVECVRELMGNPVFKDLVRYAPERLYSDSEGRERIYDEMWTADWWGYTELSCGGCYNRACHFVFDKTQLSRFSGDKQAWPVYLSIGNVAKSTRRQPASMQQSSLGTYRSPNLNVFLLHGFIGGLGATDVEMICVDGCVRRVHPILAAYIADHPEQCLVTGCQENCCPKCAAHPTKLGDPIYSTMKEPEEVLRIIAEAARGERPAEFKQYGLRLIQPFWSDLPHCNIFACITPDLLHQLHKGVFKDHTVSWATECIDGGAKEIDYRFKAMPTHPTLRHFKKGISLVTQWTGTEYKNMEKVFLGVLTGASDLLFSEWFALS
ncbi:hypothetical protein A0H81_05568 [Grifola frondosa]|uniref:C2H2-type domain-containing protein n=1 Tax=Grifola frondosa TaxID=5627 RepID=A0A1C7MCR0_GRIFR|nr:hypothetical protein A0H81_05568 [Grifola frondosa]